MKSIDQCPSSHEKGEPSKVELAQMKRELPKVSGGATGLRAWRGVEEIADTPEFRDWLEREFPAGASELSRAEDDDAEGGDPTESTRRGFLKIMGASLALAGAATLPGCRRPDHKILPYSARVPEEVIPGKPLYYASAMPLPGGGAEGLLVETHEGRPTKVEGNPLHPINRGKSTTWSQASVLGLYDTERLKFPRFRRAEGDVRDATWDDFRKWAQRHFATFDRTGGQGLAFVMGKRGGPSREAARERLRTRFPRAAFAAYESVDVAHALGEGTRLAFGAPMRELPIFAENGRVVAKVVVSLDRDFLDQSDPYNLVNNREFAATRRVLSPDDEMSRLYVVESGFGTTGAQADHRLRVSPSRIATAAVSLARAVLERVGGGADVEALKAALGRVDVPAGEDVPQAFIDAMADDLVFEAGVAGEARPRRAETLVLVGASQPAAVQAIGHALNAVLGNIGKTVRYIPMPDELAADGLLALADVAKRMETGEITTVVCIGANPVYDAPAELGFASAYAKVTGVCLSVERTETALASTWALNGAHFLESWGDAESWDGTIAPVQPMIAPLFEPALSEIEFMGMVADPNAGVVPAPAPEAGGEAAAAPRPPRVDDGHHIVRSAWRAKLKQSEAEFDRTWRRTLHDGVLARSTPEPQSPRADLSAIAREVAGLSLTPPPGMGELDVAFVTHHVHDGRFANNPWLHELPHVGTRVVWDNPALVSPKTAAALNVLPASWSRRDPNRMYTRQYPEGRVARITVGGRSIEIAVWILPGMADNTVLLPLGYGRRAAGLVGDGVGFDVGPVRTTATRWHARGARLDRLNQTYMIASTQTHWSVDGRTSLVRQVDLPAWRKHGGGGSVKREDILYGTWTMLPFGERVGHGELTHTPPNINIYRHPFKQSDAPYRNPDARGPAHALDGKLERPEEGSTFDRRHQWGMSIDLSTCTGCGACTIACQAENNIPVVGKKEVAKGREMSWIRVDRYFVSDFKEQEFDEVNEPAGVLHQPVACVHCENAPCEVVCPVNATVHGPEGHNYMVYNRCIGTRYCANNCPYKVRRFNYFDYGVKRFNGEFIGRNIVESIAPDRGGVTGSGDHNRINVNLIPPRLRERLTQIERMQKNPDVTIRIRGVMEKCSYCIQRTNEARIEMRLNDIRYIPDGFVQAACQQACPSNSIYFGDIRDEESNGGKGSLAKQMREHQRSYMLLAYLNTRPRTSYMVRVVNPNPKLRKPVEDPFGGQPGGQGGVPHGARPMPDGGPEDQGRSVFLRDAGKKLADKGYALSLRILGV